jgi:hypothetical protein
MTLAVISFRIMHRLRERERERERDTEREREGESQGACGFNVKASRLTQYIGVRSEPSVLSTLLYVQDNMSPKQSETKQSPQDRVLKLEGVLFWLASIKTLAESHREVLMRLWAEKCPQPVIRWPRPLSQRTQCRQRLPRGSVPHPQYLVTA